MSGAFLKRRIEGWPARTKKLVQAVFGKADVQTLKRLARPVAERFATLYCDASFKSFSGAGNPADQMAFERFFEGSFIHNFEKDKNLDIFLKTDQNVTLNVIQIEHWSSRA